MRERGIPWYKGEGREMENMQKVVTSVRPSWDVGFRKPRTILLILQKTALKKAFEQYSALKSAVFAFV